VLLILPPSETKRDGGDASRNLDLETLGFSSLTPARRSALKALRELSTSIEHSTRALKLGPTQAFEIERNRVLRRSAVMPAVERYTGVIYDALDVASLTGSARAFAAEHLAIGSALFGLLRADDPIPAYRLSHDSRLPGLQLGGLWRAAVGAELARQPGLVLDLRSEPYAALGRAPTGALYLRVLTSSPDGARVALSHFNKQAKGEFTRRVLESGVDHESAESLISWARANDITLDNGAEGELNLVV
jgi:uncharacterized protein